MTESTAICVLAGYVLLLLWNEKQDTGSGRMVFGKFAIGTAERIGASLAQEFLLGRFTRRGRNLKGSE
jgi:hypothetical protein